MNQSFSYLFFYFFFFQAEDGIRDRNVTGVQTCALPIYSGFGYLSSFIYNLSGSSLATVNKLQRFPNPESLHSVISEANNSSTFQDQGHFSWQFQLSLE